MFNLNVKIQDQMKEMGSIAYALIDAGKSLDQDKKLKAVYAKIKKLEWQLSKIEGGKKAKTAVSKKTAKKQPGSRSNNNKFVSTFTEQRLNLYVCKFE